MDKNKILLLQTEMQQKEMYANLIHKIMKESMAIIREFQEESRISIFILYSNDKKIFVVSNDLLEACCTEKASHAFYCENREGLNHILSHDIYSWLKNVYPKCKFISNKMDLPEFSSGSTFIYHFIINE